MLFHTLSVSQQTAPHTIQSLLVHPLTPGFPITEYCAWRTLLSLVSLLFRLWYYSFAYGSSIIVTLATTFSFALLVHYCCLSVLVFFFFMSAPLILVCLFSDGLCLDQLRPLIFQCLLSLTWFLFLFAFTLCQIDGLMQYIGAIGWCIRGSGSKLSVFFLFSFALH